LIDDDIEEEYTALLVMECAEACGIKTRLVKGLSDLKWKGGVVVDKEGLPVTQIWKTWSWETAVDDFELVHSERPSSFVPIDGTVPRLSDVLFQDDAIVFEPLWKIIPSNKAILPIMWEMNRGHPNLLVSEWALTEELKAKGYASKPIVGRCGQNIVIHSTDGSKVAQSEGKFTTKDLIFQELFELPKFDGYHAIIGGWIIGGIYAGAGIREDKSIITNVDSPCSAVIITPPPLSESDDESVWETFGTKIGASPNGVISYSSYYKTAPRDEDFNSFITVPGLGDTKIFSGAKWQCVEYARRYLLLTLGVTFPSIPMAWNIFTDLNAFENALDKSPRKISKHLDGSASPPHVRDLRMTLFFSSFTLRCFPF
jgi:hypothetical protein